MHCKKSQFLNNFLQNSLYFRQDGFVNLPNYGNLKQKNIYMLALKRSTYASLVGFFLLSQFFLLQLGSRK